MLKQSGLSNPEILKDLYLNWVKTAKLVGAPVAPSGKTGNLNKKQ
jgi:hypothetical protein